MAHILLPTDFSANAMNAANYAVQLFGVEGNTFTVLNSYMLPHGAASSMWSIDGLLAKEAQEGTDDFVARLRSSLPSMKIDLRTAVEHGDLPNVVARFSHDADKPQLVVMGTQGASGLKEVLLGSNTADVIKGGGFPVLTVPENTKYETPKRIVVADDGGPIDKGSLQILIDIARWSKAEVLIVRVINEDTTVEPGAPDARFDELLGAIPRSHHYVSGENVMQALNGFADQSDANMVVVLHRKRSIFEQLFHTSTATKLAMHTHIPMLVLQQQAD
ncbi:MAG: universal stress protein [Flavobacteriales bacterium]|nr:universal stress protein [Flavobacteriales bacterium]